MTDEILVICECGNRDTVPMDSPFWYHPPCSAECAPHRRMRPMTADEIDALKAKIVKLEGAIRKTWRSLDEAPPPGWITQDMRNAICSAGKLLSPTPWEDKAIAP